MSDVEKNPHPDPYRAQPITRGDFVDVRLHMSPSNGFFAYILRITDTRLDLRVHQAFGPIMPDANDKGCRAWNMSLPMTSVAWIKHQKNRPTGCGCSEGLS